MGRFERFTLAIASIYKCWHQIASSELQRFGLKGPHAIYLVCLKSHYEGLTMPELCQLLSKDKADVSRMIRLLEDKSLVSKDGGYRASYHLTEEGDKIASIVVKKAKNAVKLAGKDLTDEQRDIFYCALESIVMNLKKIYEEVNKNNESIL